ncbi:MAG: beta-lactamase family protein [Bacteroidales bacterium]|nr:beta-lactamase family protein [Bacteroidales bacterium]
MKKIHLTGIVLLTVLLTVSARGEKHLFDKEIQATLQPYIDRGELPGIVTIVAQKEEIKSIVSVGFQNIAAKKPMTPDALFWIASQTKPVTAAAVMILVEEGKLNLDEPVTAWLPELKKLMVTREKTKNTRTEELLTKPVTLRNLLSHTSGMRWVNGMQEEMGVIDCLPLKSGVCATVLTPLDTLPGAVYRYSNQGVNIAAAIVEKVSGMPFEEFLQKRIFNPLGMKNTAFWPSEVQLKSLAIPYKKGDNGILAETAINQLQYPLSDKTKRHPEAAGGLFSTPRDLVKFYQMLANSGVYKGIRILQESSVREMTRRQTAESMGKSYGFCLDVTDRQYGHGGSYGTDTRVDKNTGLICMYFIQQDRLDGSSKALNAFRGKAKELFDK